MADNLSYTILNSDDPQTVAQGAPAYLLLMDSFLIDDKPNPELLLSAASLYSAYSSIFVTQPERSKKMSAKALAYAEQALCINNSRLCHIKALSYAQLKQKVRHIDKQSIGTWYILGSTWATWIKAHRSSMSAVAELPKVELIMSRIIDVDESWENGQAQLYLGVLKTLLPPALGGKPEQGRAHFEQGIKFSQGNNLMAKVLLAEKYARLIFNKELHDQLLQEVIQADPYIENYTLMNILAQKKAHELLHSSSDYF
jgi:hypothetical protein